MSLKFVASGSRIGRKVLVAGMMVGAGAIAASAPSTAEASVVEARSEIRPSQISERLETLTRIIHEGGGCGASP
jgi:hypothetical protein